MPAVKQLFVLRHAKSSWDDPGLDDHDRPLAARGQRATRLLADYVRRERIEPAQVICSSALRARQTYDGVAPPGELLIEPELYGADAGELIERLRRVPDDVESVMVIGHNPTLQMLVLRLASGGSEHGGDTPLEAVSDKFPTGALATLELSGPWSELGPGRARLTGLVRPRDLG